MRLKILFFLSQAFAATAWSGALESRVLLENYSWVQFQEYEASFLNSDNRTTKTPRLILSSDFRPELMLAKGSQFKMIVRPKVLVDATETKFSNPEEVQQASKARFDLSDAFVESEVNSSLRLTVGLQVYQWGPAELLSPSNPLFHFNTQGRSSFYKEKGQVLVRANVDWTTNFNTVFISEPISNRESEFVGQTEFVSKFLVRNEYRNTNGQDYAGFTAGREELQNSFVGEYFNSNLSDTWSVYADAKHNWGRISYKPNSDLGYVSLSNKSANSEVYTLATAGVRYQGDWDYRLEAIFNEEGWTKEQLKLALTGLQQLSPAIYDNISRFQRPGLELLGQQYLYFSVRMPDLGPQKKYQLSVRQLVSLQDNSSVSLVGLERNWGDRMTLYAECNFPLGPSQKELNLLSQKSMLLGFKWSL